MRLIVLSFLAVVTNVVSGQEIVGKWYSYDSTRIYTIYKKDDQYEAILEKSSRKDDKGGALVLQDVTYRNKKKRFEGVIYTVSTGLPTFAKIRFEDKEGKVLRLRLRRMFFMNVTIRWYRVEESKNIQPVIAQQANKIILKTPFVL